MRKKEGVNWGWCLLEVATTFPDALLLVLYGLYSAVKWLVLHWPHTIA
ncbi:MAG: hypothetical protein JSS66_10190 [Armatimonadetes bacterium]|nr:hypothetical protein [Armatimonadota bacterium]